MPSTYDALGRLTRKDFDDGTTELRLDQTYRADGQLASQTRYADLAGTTAVATTSYAYDAGGRLTGLHHREGDGDTITQATYVYDDHGRLTQQVLDGTPTTFTYDDADQLTGDGTSTFTFDANGNRTNGSHATTTGNRLTTDGTWDYSYDDEGNLTGKTGVSTGKVWSYGYDHRNQLVLAEHKASSSDPVDLRVAFKYDSLGNRLEKSVDADGDGANDPVAVRYVLDGWNPSRPTPVGNENWDVLAELHADGSLKTRYLRGDVVDQLFARVDGEDPYWYLTDRQGSIRHITDATGTVVDTLTYDGYGNILSETNPSVRGNYAYTSREYDTEIDLQYNRARYYDPSTGRWLSQDPLGYDAGDSNLYRYVHNRPTGATDPSGLSDLISHPIHGSRKQHLYYDEQYFFFWRTSPVYVGTHDPDTGLVERFGAYVPYQKVSDLAEALTGGTPDWNDFFRKNDVVGPALAREEVEKNAALMKSMWDWPRSSGAKNVTEADDEFRRLLNCDFPRHAATLLLTHFGPGNAMRLVQGGYQVIRNGRRVMLASRVGSKVVVHSEAETLRILRSLNGGRLIPGSRAAGVVGGDSQALARNIMRQLSLNAQAVAGHAAHHIIPKGLRNLKVLKKIGMELDHANNGIFLPTRQGRLNGLIPSTSKLPTHAGNHPGYTAAIKERIESLPISRSIRDLEDDVFKIQQAGRYLLEQGNSIIPKEGGTVEFWRRLFSEALK